jgi:hypothetical protein
MSYVVFLQYYLGGNTLRNRLLSITRKSIPYIKELRPVAGSVTACILWQQLDFHFAKKPEGFYKFLEPCNHNAYKSGDSWIEELGFSKEEFRTAFKKIGIVYKSKRMHDCAEQKFKLPTGKEFWFCSYHDKTKGLTYYFRNHQYVDSTLDLLLTTANQEPQFTEIQKSVNRESQSTEIGNPDLCESDIPISVNRESQSTEIRNPDLRKSGIPISVNRESQSTEIGNPNLLYLTENTTENTTKITHTQDLPDIEKKKSPKKNRCACFFSAKKIIPVTDFEQQAWDWAKSDKFWKGRITKLNIRERLADGEPFRIQFEQALEKAQIQQPSISVVQQTDENANAENVDKIAAAIEACPYCDETGAISFKSRKSDGSHQIGTLPQCDHNIDHINGFFIKSGATEISTARPGYRTFQSKQSSQPKQT